MSIGLSKWSFLVAVMGLALVVTGCNQSATETADSNPASAAADRTPQVTEAVVDDGGWWCEEHGVPEEECARCDATLVAGFKEKGDWCEEHNRPESQCFLCSAKRFDKFAARYEAKFGAKPPKPTE